MTHNSVRSFLIDSLISPMEIRKVLTMMLCVLTFATVLAVAGTANVNASPSISTVPDIAFSQSSSTVPNVTFSQIDFSLDGVNVTDSPWGEATIVYEPNGMIKYVNLVTNGTWVIQNIPLMPIGNEIVLDFDLGVENGTRVTHLEYAFNITTDPLETMPGDSQMADVANGTVIMYSGVENETLVFSTPEMMIGGNISDHITPGWHDPNDIVNQPVGKYECGPGAVSNSLKFLNKKRNLGLKEADISINKMRDALGMKPGPHLAPKGWWNTKKKYMKDNGYPITTAVYDADVDLDFIIKEITRGQDVEMCVTGHVVQVVGISKMYDGNYIIGIAHDTDQKGQDKPGGEQLQTCYLHDKTRRFKCGKALSGKKLVKIVVECPIDNETIGGIWVPADKLALLAPYSALASIILVATAATAIYVKRRKKKQ